jgi:probable rRNA maturation factor
MSEDCDSRSGVAAQVEAAEPEPEPEPDARLSVDIVVQSGDWPDSRQLETLASAVARAVADELALPKIPYEVALALSSDSAVQALNRDFRSFDKPTNVLSFPAPTGDAATSCADQAAFLGDIILAAETLRREAAERAVPLHDHFAHLLAHGILHLFGYDHEADAPATEMEALERRILGRLGIPDPYATDQLEEEALGSDG